MSSQSQWTSKYAIMRDLSLAQGFDVPAELDNTLGANEKPPAPNITEETEEEYFGHCVDIENEHVAPDLSLIQQMLEMVRGTDISSKCDDDPEEVLQISKPSSQTLNGNATATCMTLPVKKQNEISQNPLVIKQKKKRQNVAVNSILEAIARDSPIANMEHPKNEPLKLLKPTDFITTEKEIVESVEKVNGWLDSQSKDLQYTSKMLSWEPSSMFKRKSNSTAKSAESDSIKSSPPQKMVATTASYRPSTLADEYYQKYMERSKLKALVKEDVWTRAERVMKEIDEKKKIEVDVKATDLADLQSGGDAVIAISPEMIQLPQHRHLLTGDCIVCEVVKCHGFHVQDDST